VLVREAEMLFNITVRVGFTGNLDGLERMLDRVMEELIKLRTTDPSIGGTLPDGDIEFSLAVEGETLQDAVMGAFGTIRTAIHAAEGGTGGWPEFRGEGITAELVHA
jgi:hypothetical protein